MKRRRPPSWVESTLLPVNPRLARAQGSQLIEENSSPPPSPVVSRRWTLVVPVGPDQSPEPVVPWMEALERRGFPPDLWLVPSGGASDRGLQDLLARMPTAHVSPVNVRQPAIGTIAELLASSPHEVAAVIPLEPRIDARELVRLRSAMDLGGVDLIVGSFVSPGRLERVAQRLSPKAGWIPTLVGRWPALPPLLISSSAWSCLAPYVSDRPEWCFAARLLLAAHGRGLKVHQVLLSPLGPTEGPGLVATAELPAFFRWVVRQGLLRGSDAPCPSASTLPA